jgi:hypothetical protein
MVNGKGGHKISLIPKLERHTCTCKERKTNNNYVSMLMLSGTILLMCVGARNQMRNATLGEKGIQFFLFSSPIRLDGQNLSIQDALHMLLKNVKLSKHLGLMFQEKNSSVFGEIIDEANIISVSANRTRRRTPHI